MMKKLFAVIMMLLTILPLAACGNKTDDSTEPDITVSYTHLTLPTN